MENTSKGGGRFWIFLIPAAFLLLACCFLRQNMVFISGDSMLPALEAGDRLLISRASYLLEGPKRFDIVVFSYHYKPDTYYIKRVIALPGETVRIRDDGVIYVNGKALIEHYGNAPIQDGGLATNEITLGEDEYFVLGDNRNSSIDSREPEVGNIKRSDIVGKGWFCLYPLERFGVLE